MENNNTENRTETYGIIIEEFQLTEKRTSGGMGGHTTTTYPYIKYNVPKKTYEEYNNEGKFNPLKTRIQEMLEKITMDYCRTYGINKISIIGYNIHKDLRGDNWENNGYLAEVTYTTERYTYEQ